MLLSHDLVLIFLALAALLCISIAWQVIWGRLLPSKNSSDDPWSVKRPVAAILAATEIDSGESPAIRKALMDPEDAVRLVIQTRRIVSASFIALAALIVLCLAVLTGVLSRRENTAGQLRRSDEMSGQHGSDSSCPTQQIPSSVAAPNDLQSSPTTTGDGDQQKKRVAKPNTK